MTLYILILTFSSFILSWCLLKISIPYLIKNVIDKPNHRSSHKVPKPTGGGISFVISGVIMSIFTGNFLPIFCLPLAFVGFIDDLISLKRSIRFSTQLITVTLIIYESQFMEKFGELDRFIYFILFILLIIIGVAIVNFINFMDGIDGLVAGSMILIFSLGSILISNSFLIFIGALFAFIIWNWYPSKVFMGDGGSTFLGGLFFGLLLDSSSLFELVKILIVSSSLIMDAFTCVLRRFINNQKIFDPHSSHLYQRLYQAGWDHSSVAILYILCILTLGISMIIGDFLLMIYLLLIQLLIGLFLDQKIATPFLETIEK